MYIGAIHPHEYVGGFNNSRAAGLAEQTRPIGLWRQMRLLSTSESPRYRAGLVAGLARPQLYLSASSHAVEDADKERKVVRTSSIDLVVKKPAETAERIHGLAERLGGFLVSSQIAGGEDATRGSLTIRVPVGRFEEVRVQIHELALRVEAENVDAQDATRQYVDQAANLCNLRAEEMQHLSILKQARTLWT